MLKKIVTLFSLLAIPMVIASDIDPFQKKYESQKELNLVVAKIASQINEHIKGKWKYGSQNVKYGEKTYKQFIVTNSSLWEDVLYTWKDNEGNFQKDMQNNLIIEPTIAPKNEKESFSKCIMDLLENNLTMECSSARKVIAHYVAIHVMGSKQYDEHANLYIQKYGKESAFSYMIESLWMDSKQEEVGCFSYIPNIPDYHIYREGGSLQGENVVMIDTEEFLDQNNNTRLLQQYLCFPCENNDGKFKKVDHTDILFSFKDDLQKSVKLHMEYRALCTNEDKGAPLNQYPITLTWICTIKGLDAHHAYYYSEKSPHNHHYFDAEKINKILESKQIFSQEIVFQPIEKTTNIKPIIRNRRDNNK